MAELITLARPYAKAAFQYAAENSQLGDWSSMLAFAAKIAQAPNMAEILNKPKLTVRQKANAFVSVCADKLSDPGKHFVSLLAENKRLSLLPEIADLFEALKAEQEKTVEVTVQSAYQLADEEVNALSSALKTRLERAVSIQSEVDKSLIGGTIIRAGDLVIDASVRGKLAKLTETLNT